MKSTARAALCALCVGAIATSVASAARPVPAGTFDGASTPAGAFGETVWKLAVDETSGDVYVLDPDHDVVDRFSSTGTYLSQIRGADTVAGSFGFSADDANDLAVDNSGGAGQSELYVLSAAANAIFKFSSSGEELWVAPGLAGATCGVAVDPNGNPWAADAFSTKLVRLRPADGGQTNTTITMDGIDRCPLAFDNDGAAYVAGRVTGFEKYAGRGAIGPDPDNRTYAVASSFRRNDLFTAVKDSGLPVIRQWDKSAAGILDLLGVEGVDDFRAIALDGVRNRLYVSDLGTGVVRIYHVPPRPPTLTARTPTAVTSTSAILRATANPNGSDIVDCHVEYVTSAQFRATRFAGATTAPCSPAAPISGVEDVDVVATVTGLTPRTAYHTRFVAVNAGAANGELVLLMTRAPPPPTVRTGVASGVTETGATLSGTVDPNGGSTSCTIQYGTSLFYEAAIAVANPGSGFGEVAVQATVAGLDAGTGYVFRLVCTNDGGTAEGMDGTFGTPARPSACAIGPSLCLPSPTCPADPTECDADLELFGNPVARRAGPTALVGVRCVGDAGGSCRGTLRFKAKVRLKLRRGARSIAKRRAITVGRATYDLVVDDTATLSVSLTAAARRALRTSALSARADGLDGAVEIPRARRAGSRRSS